MIKHRKNKGFTFVELMFAIVVMGTMFALALVVIVGMLRFYVFASSVRQNQENGRNLLDTINREVRFGELLDPTVSASKICVFNKSNSTIVSYDLLSGGNIEKRIYNYPQGVTPTGCNYSELDNVNSGYTRVSTQVVNPPRMKVVNFTASRVQGSSVPVNTNAVSVEIKLVFVTGNVQAGNVCSNNDIYCNKLELNSVTNIRGSE